MTLPATIGLRTRSSGLYNALAYALLLGMRVIMFCTLGVCRQSIQVIRTGCLLETQRITSKSGIAH